MRFEVAGFIRPVAMYSSQSYSARGLPHIWVVTPARAGGALRIAKIRRGADSRVVSRALARADSIHLGEDRGPVADAKRIDAMCAARARSSGGAVQFDRIGNEADRASAAGALELRIAGRGVFVGKHSAAKAVRLADDPVAVVIAAEQET